MGWKFQGRSARKATRRWGCGGFLALAFGFPAGALLADIVTGNPNQEPGLCLVFGLLFLLSLAWASYLTVRVVDADKLTVEDLSSVLFRKWRHSVLPLDRPKHIKVNLGVSNPNTPRMRSEWARVSLACEEESYLLDDQLGHKCGEELAEKFGELLGIRVSTTKENPQPR